MCIIEGGDVRLCRFLLCVGNLEKGGQYK